MSSPGKTPQSKSLSEACSNTVANARPRENAEDALQSLERKRVIQTRLSLFDAAECPPRHASMMFEHCRGEEWRKTANMLFSGLRNVKGFSAMLIGDRGPGKTQMAVHAIKFACLKLGWKCLYSKTVEMLLKLKQGWNENKSEIETLKPYMFPDLIVLDELQDRIEGDWSNQILTYLFDKRYDQEKSTILIANIKAGDASVRACIGSSIYDRLFECGEIVNFDWESFRGR